MYDFPPSEVDAPAQLHLPVAGHRRRIAEVRVIDVAADALQLVPVEQVQQLAANLEAHSLGQRVRFGECKVLRRGLANL